MFSGMFGLAGISKIVDIKSLILIVATVALLVGTYQAGKMAGQASSTNRENIRIIDTTRSISEGLNEFQRVNPNRDAAISLDRLRLRQSQ